MAAVNERVMFVTFVFALFCYVENASSISGEKDNTLTLEEYVNRPDPTYTYYELNRTEDQYHTTYYLNMTSQTWMDDGFSDGSVWWHDVVVSVPRTTIVSDVAILFIGGGSNTRDSIPTPEHDTVSGALQRLSVRTGVVVGFVKQVPNQPIVFKADPTKKKRTEGALCGYLWRIFIENEDASPEIIPRYPMTKAVVRAMDTLTNFTRQVAPTTNISKFVLAGASKRGWATWTATAIDKRVIAQMPIVMTCLNFHEIMEREQRSLGGWTYAMADYYYQNITLHLDHPRLAKIMDLVDPYNFIDKYNLPTMVVDGTGDQFFLLDNSYVFFSKLPGPKYMLMLPNFDHFLNPISTVMSALASFTIGVVTDYHFPRVSWQLIETETGGQIVFNSSDVEPKSVNSWVAVTDTALRRDFRSYYGKKAHKSHVVWFENAITNKSDGIYTAEYKKPHKGWLGFLVMAKYEGPLGHPLTLTSEVNIIPNTFPYPACHGEACYEMLTETGGQIVFNSSDVKPTSVCSWYAITDTSLRRDFRAYYGVNETKSEVYWFEEQVVYKGDGIYVAEYDKVDDRGLGFFVQAEYEGPLGHPLTLTSEVNIIPNTFPYPPCQDEGCYETLV